MAFFKTVFVIQLVGFTGVNLAVYMHTHTRKKKHITLS